MGLKECQIFFDNPYSTYYAGQTVNGRVVFTFDSTKKVRGVYIVFKGEAQTGWAIEENRTNDQTHETEKERIDLSGSEEYFKTQYYLIGGAGGGEHELPAGTTEFPFTCVLPPTLPSSFEGEFGHVRYTVKVVLDRPWKFDQETKAAFTVLTNVDLNANPSLKEPQRITMEKYFCCFCCKSGPLTCVVTIPKRGYVPGETIPLVSEVDNISNVEVQSVQFVFRKVVNYSSQRPQRETRKDIVVLETISVGPVAGNDSKSWNQPMVIPSLPPSNLTNCSLIDLDYELCIEAKVSGLHSNLTAQIPLVIGTIPMRESLPAPSAPPSAGGDSDGVGWAHPGGIYPSVPTFTETQFGARHIRDPDDNEHTRMNNNNFRPNYPVYNFANT